MNDVTVLGMPQRSAEWFAARCGRLTGSQAEHLFSEGRKKGEESVGRRDLRIRLALERLTGQPQEPDVYVTKDMQRGIDKEPAALLAYQARTGAIVKPAGFVSANDLQIGCSPDGQIGALEGIVEVKCPKNFTHWQNVRNAKVPPAYEAQVLHNLFVTGAAFCDFVSFDDRFPGKAKLSIVRVLRNDVDLASYAGRISLFLSEVERDYEAIATLADLSSVLKQAAGVAA